jgi:hypothetical protein
MCHFSFQGMSNSNSCTKDKLEKNSPPSKRSRQGVSQMDTLSEKKDFFSFFRFFSASLLFSKGKEIIIVVLEHNS